MIITHVVWGLDFGGVERLVLDLAVRLRGRGITVQVVSLGGGGEMLTTFKQAGVTVICAPTWVWWQRWRTVWWLRQYFTAHQVTTVHLHLGAVEWGYVAGLGMKISQRLATVHDMEHHGWLKYWLRRRALRSMDKVVCVSDVVRQRSEERYDLHETLRVIRPGIDGVRFALLPRREGLITRLVTVGRLVSGKRVDSLLRALAGVRAEWTLDIVGEGNECENLRMLTRSLGIASAVRWYGVRVDIENVLRQADAYVCMSREEGFGLAPLEAVAMGLSLVSTSLPSLQEVIDERDALWIKPEASLSDTTETLEKLFANPAMARERAMRAAMSVRHKCDMTMMVEAHAELYRYGRISDV